jgi:hypothetical protein
MLFQTLAQPFNSDAFSGFVVHTLVTTACKSLTAIATYQDSQSSNPGAIPGSATKLRPRGFFERHSSHSGRVSVKLISTCGGKKSPCNEPLD